MADKEIIIGLLEQVSRRQRSERRFRTISTGLAVALILPVIFKLVDLYSPFHGPIVVAFFLFWATATLVFLLVRSRPYRVAAPLMEAAASLDRSAGLQDKARSAYWFICNPSASEWVEALIRKAAHELHRVPVNSLYARSIPRALYRASALLALFVVLNFLPYSLNHNWLYLQGAPPYRLSHAERALVDKARNLLQQSNAKDELERIVTALEQGKVSSADAQQQLADLRQQIDSGNLELHNILDGLNSIANELGQASALASTAQAMSQGDLASAADQIRELADKLGLTPEDVLRELQKSMSQAAASSPAALQDLARQMKNAADALKAADNQAGKVALDNLAQALDSLGEKINGQQQQSQAGRQLADLQDALQREAAAAESAGAQMASASSPAGGGGGEPATKGGSMTGDASANGQGTPGGGPSGSSGAGSADASSDPGTKLEVQLKKEGLQGQNGKGGELQDLEEASRQERSAMDYRNVPSQLSPAQKDALNQNRLPREQREIVKYYFDEIRPQTAKAK